MRPLTLVALVAVWSSGAAKAEDENDKLGITVEVDPVVAIPWADVKVSGKTTALGADPTVKIEFVIDPGAEHADKAPTIAGTAKVNAKGDYSATIRMEAQGQYNVNVTAPDGKGTAHTLFILLDPPEIPDEVEKSVVKLGEGLQKMIESLRTQLAGIPANPARLQAEEKLGKVETKMKEWAEQVKTLKAATDKFTELPRKFPETAPLLHARLQKLTDVVGKNKEEQARIDQELARSRAANATCEKLDQIIEGLKVVSAALNFVQSGLKEVVQAFGLDVASDSIPAFTLPKSLADNAAAVFAVKEVSKVAGSVALGPVAWATAIIGLVVDCSGFVQEQNFAKYCEKIEGPMKATMHAVFKQEDAEWWTYDITLEGKLVLRYAKGMAPGAAVHVSGEFLGSATKLAVWEDALAVLYPVTKKTSTLLRKLVVPPGFPYSDVEGKTVGASSPNAFNVAVEGDIVADKLTLTLGDARSDISDAVEAHVTYVLIGPMILAPIIVKYDLPFTKAHKLLFRAMSDGPVEIPVQVTTKTMTLAKAFTRKRPAEGNVVDYTLSIKACNPGCK